MRLRAALVLGAFALTSSLAVANQPDAQIVMKELRPQSWDEWSEVSEKDIAAIKDDDIQRHATDPDYFAAIKIDEWYIRENGFLWHLLRFTNTAKPVGPLWMAPHDDENAAFEGVIGALKLHGGVAIVVNSGPGSARRQAGYGTCGVRADVVTSCDPNRNFSAASPKFTNAFLRQRAPGQPVIALHTNSPGFAGDGQGGRGEITILDAVAFRGGKTKVRADGHFAVKPSPEMANYDTLGLTAYLARDGKPGAEAVTCRNGMTSSGVHFWHEKVARSDGSMSNYLALNHPDVAYFNAESRQEPDLSVAARRHGMMVAAYLKSCVRSGDQPVP